MNRLAFALLLSLSAFTAQAQSTDTTAADTAATEEATVITAEADAKAPAEATAKEDANCVRETGSRVGKADAKGCNGLPGRAYTRADLDGTGAVDVSEALRRLDPSISR